jgi:CubicO group peptidase (beta-lactamase class C family)
MKHNSIIGVGAAALAFLLYACGSSDGSSVTPDSQSNPGNYSNTVITQAMIDSAVAKLDGIALDAMQRSGVPGMAIAVVHNDRTVFAKGYGVRSLGDSEPVDVHTVFQLASLSKSVGATVVAAAVGDGTVAWDDPVRKYLPNFELNNSYVTNHVTIADLYSHRSGLPDHAGDLLEDIGYGRNTVLSKLHYYPLEPFRANERYTNFGLTAAAEAVAAAEGTSWASLSKTRLYDRLGMNDTSSTFADFMARQDKALGHIKVDGVWEPTPQQRDPDAQSPAGGVSSSVSDMAKWMCMLLNAGTFEGDTVVNPQALFAAVTPHAIPVTAIPEGAQSALPDARPSTYALGIGAGIDASGRVRYSHSGAFMLGAATAYVLLPSEHLGIIVLTNGAPYGIPEAVAASFMDEVERGSVAFDWLSAYAGRFAAFYVNHSKLAGKTPPANPTPALPYGDYTGTYTDALYGTADVTVDANGSLSMALGPVPMHFALSHWDGNTFSYMPTGENAVGISAVDFNVSGGAVVSMTVEHLDENGLGTFIKQ